MAKFKKFTRGLHFCDLSVGHLFVGSTGVNMYQKLTESTAQIVKVRKDWRVEDSVVGDLITFQPYAFASTKE